MKLMMIKIFIFVATRFGKLPTTDPVVFRRVGLVVWAGNGVVEFTVAVEKDSKGYDSLLDKIGITKPQPLA